MRNITLHVFRIQPSRHTIFFWRNLQFLLLYGILIHPQGSDERKKNSAQIINIRELNKII